MVISGLERQRRRRVGVFVDGRFALSLGLALVQEKGLHSGQEVSNAELRALRREDDRRRAFEAALNLLSYRPRSEKEMRLRLARRAIEPPVIDDTVKRLKRLHYLDDAAFAQFWRETRDTVSPRSRRLMRSEMLFKGITADTAATALEGLDDEDAAYRAAAKRLSALTGQPHDIFRRRLGGFLVRRGFGYEVVRRTLERCWLEIGGKGEP